MRPKFFFFAMLASVAASAQVTNVEPVSANYANKTVSFRVWWNTGSRDATHLSKVWVWIDYVKVNANNTTSGNSWTRAAVSAASPTASVSYDGSNRQGFWLQGNSDSYSATVTVQLNITELKFNWCAYVSDCPPNVTAANGTYTLKGTPPFTLIASDGITTQTVSETTLATSALTITPTTIRDKTECPGIFCPYQGSDLFIDVTHLCQQRTSGAQNWEAWIKDTRDNELYRIVFMPDDKWWLAQNVKLASYNGSTVGVAISGCTKDECGRIYTWAQAYGSYGGSSGANGNVQGICPSGWLLPITSNYASLVNSIGSNAATCERIRAHNSTCSPITDYYGFASVIGVLNEAISVRYNEFYTNDTYRDNGFIIDGNETIKCGDLALGQNAYHAYAAVRCFRQL
ncbi:MAG: hypothetical protein LBF81_05205 [Prevotellaceae bacterium]|jgi:uncharacterized protein (TIGR02145 family)|nr:hypothetical protein [Prevotellaceae bacterium]